MLLKSISKPQELSLHLLTYSPRSWTCVGSSSPWRNSGVLASSLGGSTIHVGLLGRLLLHLVYSASWWVQRENGELHWFSQGPGLERCTWHLPFHWSWNKILFRRKRIERFHFPVCPGKREKGMANPSHCLCPTALLPKPNCGWQADSRGSLTVFVHRLMCKREIWVSTKWVIAIHTWYIKIECVKVVQYLYFYLSDLHLLLSCCKESETYLCDND